MVVNEKAANVYFSTKLLQDIVRSPLVVLGKEKDFDISVRVLGGGVHSQAEAVRHGIARALVRLNSEFRAPLRAHGFRPPAQR